MECPSCHSVIPDGSKFCSECGTALSTRCPSCGAEVRANAKFCAECGHNLSAKSKAVLPPPPPSRAEGSAERRQLTVMFVDLVGSTALSARLDPEDMREIIGAYHRCCAKQITKAGGFVAKYMGDGVLAYFGYPEAHEDDAERAVRSALTLVDAVRKLQAGHDAVLAVRVGIATGLVVVGDLIGEGDAQERGIVGDTPNLAARLQGIAEPNTVVIADRTRALLGNLFELEDLGPRDLKGIAGPGRAWVALRPSSIESRFEAMHATGLTALIGREEECETLQRRWQRAKAGEGQVVLLSGEAGIGKSRLTAELLERLAAEPHTRLRYLCSPQHTDSALYPIIGQMQRAAGLAHGDTPKARLDKLDAVLAQTSTSIQDAALLAEMLSLPNDGRYPVVELAPQQRRQRTLEALMAQLTALARQEAVLMIFEDAHWIDPTSLEALGRTVDRIKALRVMLIVTFRPEFAAPWIGQVHVTSLTLNRLGDRDAAAIITRLVGNKGLSDDVMAEIVERTDGIPLFVEEMTKAALEAESEDAAVRTVAATSSPARAVPASLHASLMARLDRLGPAKEVAQTGAAIGREFSHALLAAAAGKPEAELGAALDRLIDAGLLFRQGAPPHASYLFKHALVQDAAYGTLLRGPRRALHARIAEILETRFPEIVTTAPALLAQHFAEAAMIESAVGYWLKAGKQALARSAAREAVAHLTKGLKALNGLPDTAARWQRELDLRVSLGPALRAGQGWPAAALGENYARTRELCEHLHQPQHLGSVLFGQYTHHRARGELRLASEQAEALLQLGETRKNAVLTSVAHHNRGEVNVCLGEFAAGRADLEQSLALLDANHRGEVHELTGADLHVVTLLWLSKALARLGYLDQARMRREAALAEARQLSDAFSRAYAILFGLFTERGERPADARLLLAEELLDLSAEHGFPLLNAAGAVHRGWCLSMLGRQVEGIAQLNDGLDAYRSIGNVLAMPYQLTLLAEAYGVARQPEAGLECLAEAARLIEQTLEREFEAELYRVRGELQAGLGDWTTAEESYHAALAVARRQIARLWELRAAISLARLWRDQGKRTEARDLLAPIFGWFTEGFDTPDLKEAKALLDELA
jgi:class 3 adenylate cyclase/predicted ATPase